MKNTILNTIGNTPLVKLQKIVPATSASVYVKLEYFNPTGSYKDRMALAMIEEAEARGELRKGMTVVEYTGGSTGSSLAFICAVKGYAFRVVSSDAYAQEKLSTMKVFGADLEIVPSENQKITKDLLPKMIAKAHEIAASPNSYFTDQFNNRDELLGYAKIGQELLTQVPEPIDVFCGAVGTAGMLMGVAHSFEKHNIDLVAFEPASSAVISTGVAGTHSVEGIGVGFVPPLLVRERLKEVRAVEEKEAKAMAKKLAQEEGIFAGTSTGLNVVGALQLARELGRGHTVVTVACDSGLKYLNGDLYKEENSLSRK
ncbi:MAG: cysteine synthase family protein [Bacteroidota bacterium]